MTLAQHLIDAINKGKLLHKPDAANQIQELIREYMMSNSRAVSSITIFGEEIMDQIDIEDAISGLIGDEQ